MRFSSFRRLTWYAMPALIAAGVSTACAPRQAVVHATVPPANAPVEGVTITGFGKASGAPNVARANIGVETRAATADQAMREANTGVQQVIAALKRLGIADADLRTQGVSLNFEREEPPPQPYPHVQSAPAAPAAPAAPGRAAPRPGKEPLAPSEPAPVPGPRGNYRAANTLEVTIRDLARAGEVLGAASAAGANLMFGLEFDVENRAPLEAQARQKAVEDARARAEGLAQLSGVRLGRVLSISEGSNGQPGPSPMMMMRADAGNVPFERGELTIASSVTIVYALAR